MVSNFAAKTSCANQPNVLDKSIKIVPTKPYSFLPCAQKLKRTF